MRGSPLGLLAAVALPLAACSVYDTSLLHQNASGSGGNGQGGSSGAGGEGQSGGPNGGAGGSVCGHATFPLPPDPASIITAGGNKEIVSVMSKIDLGDSPPDPIEPSRYLNLGFDLDNRCTTLLNKKTGQECRIPSYGYGMQDGIDGQDNALGYIVQFTRDRIGPFSSELYSAQLRKGVTNVIYHATGYNGELNDDQITVETLVSAPFDSPPSTKGTLPKWDGSDVWPIASDSLDPKTQKALFVDNSAYVVNGKVVVTLTGADLRLVVGLTDVVTVNLDLNMRGAFIVCDLVKTTVGHWGWTAKNCNLGARWVADELVHQLSHFPDPATNLPLCTKARLYPVFKDNICGVVDVSKDGLASPGTQCDSISMGLNFDTEPALLGNVFQVNRQGDLCTPEQGQPSKDSCGSSLTDGGAGGSAGAGGTGGGGKPGSGGTKAEAGTGTGGSPKDASKG